MKQTILSAWWIGISGELVVYYCKGLPKLLRYKYPLSICMN